MAVPSPPSQSAAVARTHAAPAAPAVPATAGLVRGESKRLAKEAAGPPPKRARAGDKASAPAIFTGLVLFVSVGPNVSMKRLEILRDLVRKHGGRASGGARWRASPLRHSRMQTGELATPSPKRRHTF